MATRETIYLLEHELAILLSPPDVTPSQVFDEWALSRKRADALQTLYPDKYPSEKSVKMAIIDDLQERNPTWKIIYGPHLKISGATHSKPTDSQWEEMIKRGL